MELSHRTHEGDERDDSKLERVEFSVAVRSSKTSFDVELNTPNK